MAQEFVTFWVERGKDYTQCSENEDDALAIFHALRAQPDITSVRTVDMETGLLLRRYVKRKIA